MCSLPGIVLRQSSAAPETEYSQGTCFSLELSVRVYPCGKSRLATWSCCGNYKCNWKSHGSQVLALLSVTVDDSRELLFGVGQARFIIIKIINNK